MKTTLKISALLLVLVSAVSAKAANVTCAIQTKNGNFLTAVGGGGRVNDVLHSDAKKVGSWEKFTFIQTNEPGKFGIMTKNGNYLTAVGRGGRITDVLHSDATQLAEWEKFTLVNLQSGFYAIKTSSGHYLTAVSGGGRINDVIHSDATSINAWEIFRLNCYR